MSKWQAKAAVKNLSSVSDVATEFTKYISPGEVTAESPALNKLVVSMLFKKIELLIKLIFPFWPVAVHQVLTPSS